jgi:hypothetical protein
VPEIVSASRRTDIPAFHARWFAERMRAGFCEWRHPYTAEVRHVPLRREDVLAIVFWTRQPGPLMRHLAAYRASGFPMAFQFTVTGYGPPLESHNPPEGTALRRFGELARLLGPEAVLWRYDPILLGGAMTPAWHVARFARLAARLEGMTRRCTFSFVDFYGKTERNLAKVEAATGIRFERPGERTKRGLARELAAIAAERGMRFLSCCDDSLLGDGVEKSRCVDPDVVAAVSGGAVPDLPACPTRKDCGCVRSVDIGVYDTCAFGCAYCYATASRAAALRRIAEADPADSLLWRAGRRPGPRTGAATAARRGGPDAGS